MLAGPEVYKRAGVQTLQIPSIGIAPYDGSTIYQTGQIYEYIRAIKGWTARATSIRADLFTTLEWELFSKGAPTVNEQTGKQDASLDPLSPDHWLSQFWERPNPKQPWYELAQRISWWLDTTGNAYLYMPRFGGKYPKQLWVLPSWSVAVIVSKTNYISGYAWFSPGMSEPIKPEEMCHIKRYRPQINPVWDTFYGTGLMADAMDAIKVDIKTDRHMHRYLDRYATPALAIKMTDKLRGAGLEQFKQLWREYFEGPDAGDQFAVLDPGMEAIPLQSTHREVELVELSKANGIKITGIYGVAMSLITGEYANGRAHAETIDAQVYKHAVNPHARLVAAYLSDYFSSIEDGLTVKFKTPDTGDSALEQAQYQFEAKQGAITINDLRRKRNLPEVPGGDDVLVMNTLVPLELAAGGANVKPAPGTPATPPAKADGVKKKSKSKNRLLTLTS